MNRPRPSSDDAERPQVLLDRPVETEDLLGGGGGHGQSVDSGVHRRAEGLDESTGQCPGRLDRDLLPQHRQDGGLEGVEAARHADARNERPECGLVQRCERPSHRVGLAVEVEQILDPIQHHR